MGFQIKYLPVKIREKWLDKHFGLKNCIYMGDGIFDHLIMKKTYYSIAPKGTLEHVKSSANYITKSKPAERAVAEAVIHILKKFMELTFPKCLIIKSNVKKILQQKYWRQY